MFKMVKEFIAYAKIERGRSEETLKTYRSTLSGFSLWIDTKGYVIQEIDSTRLKEWSQDLFLKFGIANASTRGKMIANIRAFFSWAHEAGYYESNPASKLHSPRVPYRDPEVYTPEQLAKLFAQFDRSKVIDLRNLCMLIVTYAVALRASELINLDVRDIKDQTQFISISVKKGKGARGRTVSVGAFPAKILREWLIVRATLEADTDPLFVSLRRGRSYGIGTRLTSGYFHEIIKKRASDMGLKDSEVILHKLRATGLTDYYNSGREKCYKCGSRIHAVDLLELMRFSGHKDPNSLTRYIRITPRVQKLKLPARIMNNLEKLMKKLMNKETEEGGRNE